MHASAQFAAPRGRATELVEGHTGIVGQWRRPLLQLVVLFASDNRIYNFALKTMQRFIDAGIDVFLQVGVLRGAAAAPSLFCRLWTYDACLAALAVARLEYTFSLAVELYCLLFRPLSAV